jgi:hypothetical protein
MVRAHVRVHIFPVESSRASVNVESSQYLVGRNLDSAGTDGTTLSMWGDLALTVTGGAQLIADVMNAYHERADLIPIEMRLRITEVRSVCFSKPNGPICIGTSLFRIYQSIIMTRSKASLNQAKLMHAPSSHLPALRGDRSAILVLIGVLFWF